FRGDRVGSGYGAPFTTRGAPITLRPCYEKLNRDATPATKGTSLREAVKFHLQSSAFPQLILRTFASRTAFVAADHICCSTTTCSLSKNSLDTRRTAGGTRCSR